MLPRRLKHGMKTGHLASDTPSSRLPGSWFGRVASRWILPKLLPSDASPTTEQPRPTKGNRKPSSWQVGRNVFDRLGGPPSDTLDVSQLADILLKRLLAEGSGECTLQAAEAGPVSLRELVDLISRPRRRAPIFVMAALSGSRPSRVLAFLTIIKQSKWVVRPSHISTDWLGDISDTIDQLNFGPAHTRGRF